MKNLKILALALTATLSLSSCDRDDEKAVVVNEGELITTVTATFTPQGGGNSITLQYKDPDGEGGDDPIITISGPFARNTTYNGALTFKNELTNPATDITPEIIAEGTDHQVFYQKSGTLNPFTYGTAASNFDSNGKVIGLQSVFVTTGEASGNLTITLRHRLNKNAANVAAGDITNAAGSTDVEVTFLRLSVL